MPAQSANWRRRKAAGTEMNMVREGPGLIPVEACRLGWQESLRKPAKLVEPEPSG